MRYQILQLLNPKLQTDQLNRHGVKGFAENLTEIKIAQH